VQWRLPEAEELALLSLEVSERHGLSRSAARALNVLALVRHFQQDWEGARAVYEDALERALEIGDDELTGLVCLNLGVVANLRGALRDARVRYLESIGSAVRSGSKQIEVMAYNNLGLVCGDLGDWMEAEVHFSRGIEIAERVGAMATLARLRMNRAEPLILTGETAHARASLDHAEELAARLGDREALVGVARLRGMADRVDGRLEAADELLGRALALAAGAGLEMERGETLREAAVLRLCQGRPEEARRRLEEACDVFGAVGAAGELQRTRALLAQVDSPRAG
jgi:tetratricopeptide (TPR) repeat protein